MRVAVAAKCGFTRTRLSSAGTTGGGGGYLVYCHDYDESLRVMHPRFASLTPLRMQIRAIRLEIVDMFKFAGAEKEMQRLFAITSDHC